MTNPFGVVGDLPPAILHRLREPADGDDFLQRAHDDFLFFLAAIWEDRGLHRKAPLSWYELDMGDYAANGPRSRGILAFRGMGKTHIATSGVTCFRLVRDIDRKVFVVSKSKPSAIETVGFIREWLDAVWFLKHLAPKAGMLDNKGAFNVAGAQEARQPSVKAEGIEGQLEGNRSHTLIIDDAETKDNSKTADGREALKNLIKEAKNICYPFRAFEDDGPLDPSEIIDVGTPKHEDTVYVHRIKQGYAYQSYPIAFPELNEKVISLAPAIRERLESSLNRPGEPTCPHRFPHSEIIERQAEGYNEFARESMLIADLANANRFPLRLSDLIVMSIDRDRAPVAVTWGTRDHNGSTAIEDIACVGLGAERLHRPVFIDPVWAPFTGTKMAIDPSGSGDDMTGVAVIAHLAGFLWCKRLLGLPGGFSEDALNALARVARETNAREIYIEDNFGRGMFTELFRPVLIRHFVKPGEDPSYPLGWACSIIDDTKITNATGQKELRIIDTVEPVVSTHRLVVDPSVVTHNPTEDLIHAFQYQFSRITRQPKCLKEDGKLDALALCLKAWKHTLHVDPLKGADHAKDRVIDAQKARLDKLLGKPPKGQRWAETW